MIDRSIPIGSNGDSTLLHRKNVRKARLSRAEERTIIAGLKASRSVHEEHGWRMRVESDEVLRLAKGTLVERVESARNDAHPDHSTLSDAQREAGNYRKGHVHVQGLDITIENPKGSVRSGVSKSGRQWSLTMPHDYGYIRRTEGADGDHVDAYLGPCPECEVVFVVDQVNPDTGRFDEHKVMLGFTNRSEAVEAYRACHKMGFGGVTTLTMRQFKKWLDPDAKRKVRGRKPIADHIKFARGWNEADHPRNEEGEFSEKEEGQKRAKKGGEYGPNREWYKGGAFIATTDLPKKVLQERRKAASQTEKVDQYKREVPEPGKLAIYPRIEVFVDWRSGKINEQAVTHYGRDLLQIEDLLDKWNQGDRWVPAEEYPQLVKLSDLARLVEVGETVSGEMMDAVVGKFPGIRTVEDLKSKLGIKERTPTLPDVDDDDDKDRGGSDEGNSGDIDAAFKELKTTDRDRVRQHNEFLREARKRLGIDKRNTTFRKGGDASSLKGSRIDEVADALKNEVQFAHFFGDDNPGDELYRMIAAGDLIRRSDDDLRSEAESTVRSHGKPKPRSKRAEERVRMDFLSPVPFTRTEAEPDESERLKNLVARLIRERDEAVEYARDWKESEHPREADGTFANKEGFHREVNKIAGSIPKSKRFGDSKVYISDVFDEMKSRYPNLDRKEFDRMLIDAYKRGDVETTRMDLTSLGDQDRIKSSLTTMDQGGGEPYPFHLIRIDDAESEPDTEEPSRSEPSERQQKGKSLQESSVDDILGHLERLAASDPSIAAAIAAKFGPKPKSQPTQQPKAPKPAKPPVDTNDPNYIQAKSDFEKMYQRVRANSDDVDYSEIEALQKRLADMLSKEQANALWKTTGHSGGSSSKAYAIAMTVAKIRDFKGAMDRTKFSRLESAFDSGLISRSTFDRECRRLSKAWDESEHPRDADGLFSDKPESDSDEPTEPQPKSKRKRKAAPPRPAPQSPVADKLLKENAYLEEISRKDLPFDETDEDDEGNERWSTESKVRIRHKNWPHGHWVEVQEVTLPWGEHDSGMTRFTWGEGKKNLFEDFDDWDNAVGKVGEYIQELWSEFRAHEPEIVENVVDYDVPGVARDQRKVVHIGRMHAIVEDLRTDENDLFDEDDKLGGYWVVSTVNDIEQQAVKVDSMDAARKLGRQFDVQGDNLWQSSVIEGKERYSRSGNPERYGKWVTIGSHKENPPGEKGGVRVFIEDDGTIGAGPKSLEGRKVGELGKTKPEKVETTKPEPEPVKPSRIFGQNRKTLLTKESLKELMRDHKVTIGELAKRLKVPQALVRRYRDELGISDKEQAKTWIEAVTGKDAGELEQRYLSPREKKALVEKILDYHNILDVPGKEASLLVTKDLIDEGYNPDEFKDAARSVVLERMAILGKTKPEKVETVGTAEPVEKPTRPRLPMYDRWKADPDYLRKKAVEGGLDPDEVDREAERYRGIYPEDDEYPDRWLTAAHNMLSKKEERERRYGTKPSVQPEPQPEPTKHAYSLNKEGRRYYVDGDSKDAMMAIKDKLYDAGFKPEKVGEFQYRWWTANKEAAESLLNDVQPSQASEIKEAEAEAEITEEPTEPEPTPKQSKDLTAEEREKILESILDKHGIDVPNKSHGQTTADELEALGYDPEHFNLAARSVMARRGRAQKSREKKEREKTAKERAKAAAFMPPEEVADKISSALESAPNGMRTYELAEALGVDQSAIYRAMYNPEGRSKFREVSSGRFKLVSQSPETVKPESTALADIGGDAYTTPVEQPKAKEQTMQPTATQPADSKSIDQMAETVKREWTEPKPFEIKIPRDDRAGFKPWVASVTGTDPKFGLARKFVGETGYVRSGRGGTMEYSIDKPGLYQIGGSKSDDHAFAMTLADDGSLEKTWVSKERAREIAKRLDRGDKFDKAFQATLHFDD